MVVKIKQEIYYSKISPLIEQIRSVCEMYDINMLTAFSLAESYNKEGGRHIISVLNSGENTDNTITKAYKVMFFDYDIIED